MIPSTWASRSVQIVLAVCLAANVRAQQAQSANRGSNAPARSAQKSAPLDYQPDIESRAIDILKSARTRLTAAKSMTFTAVVSYFPFTDVIVADPYMDIADGLKVAFYIGESSVVGDTTTDLVAYVESAGGGMTSHATGSDSTTRTNALGGSETHTDGQGTTATNRYGETTTHTQGSARTTINDKYGASGTHTYGQCLRRKWCLLSRGTYALTGALRRREQGDRQSCATTARAKS